MILGHLIRRGPSGTNYRKLALSGHLLSPYSEPLPPITDILPLKSQLNLNYLSSNLGAPSCCDLLSTRSHQYYALSLMPWKSSAMTSVSLIELSQGRPKPSITLVYLLTPHKYESTVCPQSSSNRCSTAASHSLRPRLCPTLACELYSFVTVVFLKIRDFCSTAWCRVTLTESSPKLHNRTSPSLLSRLWHSRDGSSTAPNQLSLNLLVLKCQLCFRHSRWKCPRLSTVASPINLKLIGCRMLFKFGFSWRQSLLFLGRSPSFL